MKFAGVALALAGVVNVVVGSDVGAGVSCGSDDPKSSWYLLKSNVETCGSAGACRDACNDEDEDRYYWRCHGTCEGYYTMCTCEDCPSCDCFETSRQCDLSAGSQEMACAGDYYHLGAVTTLEQCSTACEVLGYD